MDMTYVLFQNIRRLNPGGAAGCVSGPSHKIPLNT